MSNTPEGLHLVLIRANTGRKKSVFMISDPYIETDMPILVGVLCYVLPYRLKFRRSKLSSVKKFRRWKVTIFFETLKPPFRWKYFFFYFLTWISQKKASLPSSQVGIKEEAILHLNIRISISLVQNLEVSLKSWSLMIWCNQIVRKINIRIVSPCYKF